MVIVQHNYNGINKPKMTNSWFLHLEDILNLYDINEGEVGIKFKRACTVLEYKIIFNGKDKGMLARQLLKLLLDNDGKLAPPTLLADVKQR